MAKHNYNFRKRDATGKVISHKEKEADAPLSTVSNRKAKAAKDDAKKKLVKEEINHRKAKAKPQPAPAPKAPVEEVKEEVRNPIPEKVKKFTWPFGKSMPTFKDMSGSSPPPAVSASSSNTSVCPYHVAERTPRSKFSDIAGIDNIKRYIMEKVVLPFTYPDNAKILKLQVPRGVLFTGKPGTGKTSLADAIVHEVRKKRPGCTYLEESGQCLSKWVGETEGGLRSLFQTAAQRAPSIIFLDEVDGLAKKRECGSSSFGTSLITTLLTEINNVEPGKVLVIAATNTQGMLDPALIRKGRIDIRIDIPLPGVEEQKMILHHYFTKKGKRVTPKLITTTVNNLAQYSVAPCDLEWLVEDVQSNILKKLFPNNDWGEMRHSVLRKKLAECDEQELSWENDVKPSIDRLKKERENEGGLIPKDEAEPEAIPVSN